MKRTIENDPNDPLFADGGYPQPLIDRKLNPIIADELRKALEIVDRGATSLQHVLVHFPPRDLMDPPLAKVFVSGIISINAANAAIRWYLDAFPDEDEGIEVDKSIPPCDTAG